MSFIERIGEDVPAGAQRATPALGVHPEDTYLAAASAAVPLEDLQRRRLVGTVGTEQREHFSLAHLKGDTAHGVDRAVALELQPADGGPVQPSPMPLPPTTLMPLASLAGVAATEPLGAGAAVAWVAGATLETSTWRP